MESLIVAFVAMLTQDQYSNGDHERITIIVPRAHAHLVDVLAKAFAPRGDVDIILDRRHGERRTQQRPVAVERRRAERRRSRGEVIEFVVSMGPQTFPSP